jgi:C-terminal peptidase prc
MRIFWLAPWLAACGVSWAAGTGKPWAKTDLDLKVSRIFITNEKCNSTPDYYASCVEAIAAANKHLATPVSLLDNDFEKTLRDIAAKLPPDVPEQRMLGDAINAHLVHFDAHAYLTPTDAFEGSRSYLGLGLMMRKVTRGFFVTEVIEDSSAERSGLRFGDLITGVADLPQINFLALSLDELAKVLRQGNTVALTYERGGVARDVALTRTKVEPKTVSSSVIKGEPTIGYIRIRDFIAGRTCRDFKIQLRALETNGAGKFILDLRGNPGGSTREATCVAGTFLGFQEVAGLKHVDITIPEKDLIQVFDTSNEIRWQHGLGVFMDISPLAVLVDGRTGSAAEILAGGLQAQNRAWLVGSRTWGKGTQQTYASVADHPSLTLVATTDRVILPNKLSHQRVGLPASFYVAPTSNPEINSALENDSEANHYPRSLPALNDAWSDPRKDEISEIQGCIKQSGSDKLLSLATGGDLQKAFAAAVLKCL